jgi:hypothetical protein
MGVLVDGCVENMGANFADVHAGRAGVEGCVFVGELIVLE